MNKFFIVKRLFSNTHKSIYNPSSLSSGSPLYTEHNMNNRSLKGVMRPVIYWTLASSFMAVFASVLAYSVRYQKAKTLAERNGSYSEEEFEKKFDENEPFVRKLKNILGE
jgi:hypothetical protein